MNGSAGREILDMGKLPKVTLGPEINLIISGVWMSMSFNAPLLAEYASSIRCSFKGNHN